MGRDSVCREPARITACWPKTAATGSAGVILPGRRQKAVLARPWGRRARILPSVSALEARLVVMVVSRQRDVVQRSPWLSWPKVIPPRSHSVKRYPSGPWETR
jgi:hypothetical protein